MPAREVAHLRLPIGVVGREFVQEDDRRSVAGFLEIQPDIVVSDGVGQLIFLPLVSCFDAVSSREPAAISPGRLSPGRLQKSQLMLTAAMRQNRFFLVMK
jgi:hypothetical protein